MFSMGSFTSEILCLAESFLDELSGFVVGFQNKRFQEQTQKIAVQIDFSFVCLFVCFWIWFCFFFFVFCCCCFFCVCVLSKRLNLSLIQNCLENIIHYKILIPRNYCTYRETVDYYCIVLPNEEMKRPQQYLFMIYTSCLSTKGSKCCKCETWTEIKDFDTGLLYLTSLLDPRCDPIFSCDS